MAQESIADFFTGPTAQEKLRLRARDLMSRTSDPRMIAKISQEAAAIERGERTHPEYEADLVRDKTRQAVAARAKELGVTPDNPADFASVAIETIMRHNYPGAERDAMLVLQWRQMQEASARAADLQRAQIEKVKAEAEGGSKSGYAVPVQDEDGRILEFDTRAPSGQRLRDPISGKPVRETVRDPRYTPTSQRRIAAGRGYGGKVGTDAGEADVKLHETALASAENITKMDTLLNHLKSSDAITGMGAELLKNVERAKVLVLDSEKAGRKVSDTELLDVMMGSEVFPMIGALGIGARGLDTPAEREFLRQVMTGSIPMNKQTLVRMTEIRKAIAKRAIDRFNKRVDSGELDQYFESAGRPKQRVELSSPGARGADVPATPGLPAGWKVKVKAK